MTPFCRQDAEGGRGRGGRMRGRRELFVHDDEDNLCNVPVGNPTLNFSFLTPLIGPPAPH
jgi:hypothetical protein